MNPSAETQPLLSDRYVPPVGFYDEFRTGANAVRPQWAGLAELINRQGVEGLSRRVETLNRLIREYGVTYNVYSDSATKQSDWAMDVVPFALEGGEWAKLEDALSQRFHLLDLILQDCYGEQRLLQGGHLPADLVLGNPAFLPACHGLLPSTFHPMQLFCADLARSPDGNWWVLSDRLDAASGLAYAIENRMLSHRVLPEGLRMAAVQPLNAFVSQYCETIEGLAPNGSHNPNVVLLTPGPHNETYFEHAFLARTLGYPLVEGNDLSVRDRGVFLKTISGLQRVDVILRRLDSDWCDPLELRSDSLLGVPGLLQAVRRGHVAIANGIGSGLMQAPAMNAYLPGLSQLLLGEDLKIPSVATWWCGEKEELDYVLENLERLVIKPAKDVRLGASVFGETLSKEACAQWRLRLKKQPLDWCAQEKVACATTPSFDGEGLVPNHFLMRVYMIRYRGGYRLMPGGLVRASPSKESPSVSMQVGAVSKDVWVMGPASHPAEKLESKAAVKTGAPIVRRSAHNLPSRMADNLFWLGRYFERTEAQTRLIRVLINHLMDEAWSDRGESTLRLLSAFAPDDMLDRFHSVGPGNEIAIKAEEAERFLREWFTTESMATGLRGNLQAILRTASGVRERLSSDAWLSVSNLDELSATLPFVGNTPLSDRTLQVMDDMLSLLSAISGLFMENMTRGHGWHFQDLGRRIERGLNLCNLIHSTLTPPNREVEAILWALLECSDCLMTYRRRYFTSTHVNAVLDLMLCDPMNPRSMAFQVDRIRFLTEKLPHHADNNVLQPIDKAALRLASLLGLREIEDLTVEEPNGVRVRLAGFLDEVAREFAVLSEHVSSHYFAITNRHSSEAEEGFLPSIQT